MVKELHFVAKLTVSGMLFALGLPAWQNTVGTPPIVSATRAPAGTETLKVQWFRVVVPDRGAMLAAVARPSGAGPFPVVLILHGTHGFARQ
jgi:hypothetical protein